MSRIIQSKIGNILLCSTINLYNLDLWIPPSKCSMSQLETYLLLFLLAITIVLLEILFSKVCLTFLNTPFYGIQRYLYSIKILIVSAFLIKSNVFNSINSLFISFSILKFIKKFSRFQLGLFVCFWTYCTCFIFGFSMRENLM